MRVVVALGGNALLRRGQPMTAENQRENVRLARDRLAPIAGQHELIISHGNGPQIGLLEQGCVVICAGGGGIPVAYQPGRQLAGVEAVIDKDRASALLAREIGADILIMATDAPAACVAFGTPAQRAIAAADPDALLAGHRAEFATGSMLPKVIAACDFAKATGQPAVVGALADIDAMLDGTAGTRVTTSVSGVEFAAGPDPPSGPGAGAGDCQGLRATPPCADTPSAGGTSPGSGRQAWT